MKFVLGVKCILVQYACKLCCILLRIFLCLTNCALIGFIDLHSIHTYILYHAGFFSCSQLRLKVYLDEGNRVAEIFVTPATKCRDIVQRLQRQIHETDYFLIEVWQGCGRWYACCWSICLHKKCNFCWLELLEHLSKLMFTGLWQWNRSGFLLRFQ